MSCSFELFSRVFLFTDTATPEIYTLSLHDALPIWRCGRDSRIARTASGWRGRCPTSPCATPRSEEHTSELQSLTNLVCRLLLEKKKEQKYERTRPAPLTEPCARPVASGAARERREV